MFRTVDLTKYVPQTLKDFLDIKYIVDAENPEFNSVLSITSSLSNASFINEADEIGVYRFEKMLGITPNDYDTIQARQSRILTRWNDTIPYTMETLKEKLTVLCGEDNFSITTDFENYSITITVSLPLSGQVEELEYLIKNLVPANLIVEMLNNMSRDIDDSMYQATAVVSNIRHTIEQEEVV